MMMTQNHVTDSFTGLRLDALDGRCRERVREDGVEDDDTIAELHEGYRVQSPAEALNFAHRPPDVDDASAAGCHRGWHG